MKTKMAATSLQAYAQLEQEGVLSEKRERVLAAVERAGNASNLDISAATGMPINTVSGISNWLVKHGYMELDHKAPATQSGRTVQFWRVKRQQADEAGNPLLFDMMGLPKVEIPRIRH